MIKTVDGPANSILIQCCVCERFRNEFGQWHPTEAPAGAVISHTYCELCYEMVMKGLKMWSVNNDQDFKDAFEIIIGHEGSYVNDKDDRGGETKWGISKKAYPELDIASLTFEDAKKIYHRDYWLAARCDELPQSVAILHFDAAVNCGRKTAARILQRAINSALRKKGEDEIKEDGIIGPITLRNAKNVSDVLRDKLIIERIKYYVKIARKNRNRKFLLGWLNRTLSFCDLTHRGEGRDNETS